MAEKKVEAPVEEEVEEAVEVSDAMPCPFCDGEMAEVSSVDTREGTVQTLQCKECGFQATFIKSA